MKHRKKIILFIKTSPFCAVISLLKNVTIGRDAFARNFRGSQNLKGSEEFLKSKMNPEAGSKEQN
jgi:hypothetical protein